MTSARNPSQPSSAGPRPVRILPVPETEAIVVCWLSGYSGLLTHYNKSGPIYCPGPADCPSSTHKSRIIWKGYAAVTWWRRELRLWQPDVLEVTERLEEQIRGRDLRGEVWSLSRQGKGAKSDPIIGEFCQHFPADKLPESFEIIDVVRRCYHCPGLKFGAANPLPPQVVLPLVEGEAPALPTGKTPPAAVPATAEEIAALRAKARKTFGYSSAADQGDGERHARNGTSKPLPGQ